MRAAGALSSIDQDLQQGRYRLIVQPGNVEARTVARLRKVEQPVALTGHGPHPLPFEAPQSLEWREPAGRDDPRTPDLWTFALAGPAKVTLTLTGDGMAALVLADQKAPLGRVIAGTPLTWTCRQGITVSRQAAWDETIGWPTQSGCTATRCNRTCLA